MSDSTTTAKKPVFLLTHSRACSTAIERVFWTNRRIRCFHEEFGAAYYFGPEKISDNWKYWKDDKIAKSGHADTTWRSVLEDFFRTEKENPEDFVFIKDMSYHIIPPAGSDVTELPSLTDWDDGAASFAFLIRSPWLAVPSLYRLHVPPRVYETQLHEFKAKEIGYREMRILTEYLFPRLAKTAGSVSSNEDRPILIDASDVLTYPEDILGQFCNHVGLPFDASMLEWDPHDAEMEKAMSKFRGYHDDAISSSGLRKRTEDEERRDKGRAEREGSHKGHRQDDLGMEMTEEEYMSDWSSRYGEEAAGKTLDAVNLCKDDYAWLRQFAIRPRTMA